MCPNEHLAVRDGEAGESPRGWIAISRVCGACAEYATPFASWRPFGVPWVQPAMLFGNNGMLARVVVRDQGALIEDIAAAHEVWMMTGRPGSETKIKLSPEQISTFSVMVERGTGRWTLGEIKKMNLRFIREPRRSGSRQNNNR